MGKLSLHPSFRLNGERFNSSAELLKFTKNFSPKIHPFLTAWFDETEQVNVRTSGSTGMPKVIILQKKTMVLSAIATGVFFGLKAGTTALLCMSSDFIAGKMMLVRALQLGWDLDVVEVDSNPLKLTDKYYNFAAMVPLQVHHSFDKLERIDQLIIGGGVISDVLLRKIKKVSTKVFATFGMTETITHIAAKRLNGASDSYYKALPDIKLSVDKRGCLLIDAPLLSPEIICTNDVVKLIDSHTFEWQGRYDAVINSGGIKLMPEQIESKLSEIISERFFISSERDELLGNKLVLIVELDAGSTFKLLSEEYLVRIKKAGVLSKYEIPKKVLFVSKFMETPTQKIQRKATEELVQLNTEK